MKKCELCDSLAKMYCESDQASLCWVCDAIVHTANFLVAKHSRTLLCHVCQSLTPWTGTGPKLGPTLSVCNTCLKNSSCGDQQRAGSEDDYKDGDDDDDGDGEDGDDDEGTDENNDDGGSDSDGDLDDEENQVVPWSSMPPPPISSSSNNSTEECSGRFCDGDGAISHSGSQHFL